MSNYFSRRHFRGFSGVSSVSGVSILRVVAGAGLACILAALTACGSVGGASHTGAQSATPTATHSAVNPGGLVVRSCSGPVISTLPAATIIVNGQATHSPITAHVGDTIQVRFQAGAQRWDEIGAPEAALNPQAMQGAYDANLDLCIWMFQAAHAGTVALHFSGQPLCEPNRPCPNYVIAVNLTFSIS